MDIQKLFDQWSDSDKQLRSNYHVTLGKLIEILKEIPSDVVIQFDNGKYPSEPHSYRGYYSDLALEPRDEIQTCGGLLNELTKVLGNTLSGYKGGDYLMDENVPLWMADYGTTSGSAAIIEISGRKMIEPVILVTKEIP